MKFKIYLYLSVLVTFPLFCMRTNTYSNSLKNRVQMESTNMCFKDNMSNLISIDSLL